jgi:hypothetical protein
MYFSFVRIFFSVFHQALHDGSRHPVNRNHLSHLYHLRTLVAVSFKVSCRNWKSSTSVML